MRFGSVKAACAEQGRSAKPVKAPRAKREKQKNDPKLVAAARELRDRWLEHVSDGRVLAGSQGKYAVGRSLDVRPHPRSTALTAGSPLPEGEGVKAMLPAA